MKPVKSMAHSALESARAGLRGRDDELAMVESAVRVDVGRPLVLVLHGGPRRGKTTLALVAHLTAVVERIPSTFIAATRLSPTPAGILEGLDALGMGDGFSSIGWGEAREVLVVDAFEHIELVSEWFFSSLLAAAGANLTLIVSSRRSLSSALAPLATLVDVVEHEVGAPGDPAGDPVDPLAVREALAAYHVPHQLDSHPLARRFEPSDRVAHCRAWLRAGIEELARSPTHADLGQVLDVTYLQGAVKQRAAAADLNLPWGTYRHRLRRAISTLAEALIRTAPQR